MCNLNDGTHTYLKPQAQHVNSPTSAIDLTMCTPGVALRCNWEVIPDSHGSDHYPVLTSVSPTSADANQGVHDPTHWVFSRADWEGFMGACRERIDDAVLQSPDPLQSFVDLIIKIADDFIPKASTIPRKSNPWFDQECRDALKTRRALDNKMKRGCGPHQETLISFKRAQARARRLFNQKKRDSWRNYVSQLTTNTPIKHVWDRVRKISGKNICPPKQYLRGKDSKAVTTPRDVANEHAAAFAGNSSSAHYSQEFLQIKEEAEKENLNFESQNTEVYNKRFRLRDLRRAILKAKPRAPGLDGVHNVLLKHLPEETLVVLKDILNGIWISGRFPAQWRAASVIPIPKPGKDHSDPLSYRPIALSSCLCKILERMINQRLIWYLEKKGILNRSQCGFRKHRCTTDHLVSLERYVRDAFAHKQQAVGLIFDLEKAYETTWQYGIMRDLHRAGLRGRLPIFVSEYLKDRKFKVRVGVTLSDEFGTEEGVPTGGVLAVTCFGLKINDLPRHIPPDIFRALFVDDLAICFRGSSLHAIERHLQHAVDAIQGWALQNGFKFAAHKCKILHFTAPRRKPERQPNIMIGHVALPVEETTKFLGLWWDSKLNFGKHITELKKQSKEAINLLRVVAHTKWGGDWDTLLMLYRAIVRSKLDYGCIVYGSASTSSLNKLNTIHNTGLRLALGAFCTSPVWSLYVEANEPPLEERRLKLSMNYFLKICAMPDNPAYLAMNKFDRSTKQLYKVRPNGRGGMIRPPTAPVGLRMKAAMKEADIDTSKISPLDIPDLPPGTHAFDPESDNLIEGVTKVEISSSDAKAKFQEYQDEQGNHDEVYTDGSKINEKVGAAAVIKRLFQDGKTTWNLSKRLPDGSSIFSAEATAIILALDYYNAMPAVRHDVVIYSDSLSCLQAIQGEDTEHPLMCRIMNLLWKLSDKGTHVKFCWIPSHCGIEGNEAADKLAKESLGLNIDALLGIYHADLKPQVNAYVQQLMQVKWDVEVHGRDLYLLKANLAPPDRYKHLKRAEEVAMTRLRIGHCKATKGHIVSRGPPAVCHHCGSTLSREHILLECGTVQELRGEFYEADSLTSPFECVRPLAIIEYLKEAGFFYLIWQVYESEIRNVKSHKPQNPDYQII